NSFSYYMSILRIRQLRLTMQRRGHDTIEVTVTAELHEAIASGRRLYYPIYGAVTAATGAGVGVVMFMLMMPILAVLTTLGTAGVMWGGLEKRNRFGYAYYLRKAQETLETLLADVNARLHT